MTGQIAPEESGLPRLLSGRTLHLMTLFSFAVTEPILTAFARQTVYIHDQQFTWIEISLLLTILMILLPLICVGLDRIAFSCSRRFDGKGRNIVFQVLAVMCLLSLLRPYAAWHSIASTGFAGLLTLAISIPGAWMFVRLYDKSQWVRMWITLASAGICIFPATFLWQLAVIQREERLNNEPIDLKNPVPVIMIVFDEFSGTTLLNDRSEVDASQFPNFARLAKQSTLYRNATTVNPRTDIAVPAILSGRFPVTDLSPLAANFPGNLFAVIESSKAFDMAVFEPISRLCPRSVGAEKPAERSHAQKCVDIVQTLAIVYPRLIVSSDLPIALPRIPPEWFGQTRKTKHTEMEWRGRTEGLFNYSGGTNRANQLEHFVRCLKPAERPRFAFLHAIIPHIPWSFLPTGEQYMVESAGDYLPAGGAGELGEDWLNDAPTILRNQYRYRLQVGYVDRFIGQVLDQLEESKLMDRCLLIVTADHGVSFRATHSRRIPDVENLADILSVPLFIKFPKQTEGRIDDRNVESIDILPTIADVIGIELPEPVDGSSVLNDKRRSRKTLYFNGSMTVVEPDFPQREAAVQRQFAIFGGRPLEQVPDGIANHPEWNGRSIDSFEIEQRPITTRFLNPVRPLDRFEDLSNVIVVSTMVAGEFDISDAPEKPAQLVVAIDGIVQDTGTSYWKSARLHGFEFLLPKSVVPDSSKKVTVYVVDQTQNRMRLRPLQQGRLRTTE